MEISTMSSRFALDTRMLSTSSLRVRNPSKTLNFSSRVSVKASLNSNSIAPYVGGAVDFAGQKIHPSSLNPPSISTGSRGKRGVVTMVIPFVRGNARKQPPPDLASYLYANRIVYLGMTLVPAVTELMVAEFLYLQYENDEKPIHMYINSTGTTKGGEKYGYETEALAIYDVMRIVKPPIFTICVGNAWGEAAMLLSAGAKGNRSALPSSTIMMKQPIARFQGQASTVEVYRKESRHMKNMLVKLFAKHTGKSREQVEEDIGRTKYFSPEEAVEYGLIDKVVHVERGRQDSGVIADLKKANLI